MDIETINIDNIMVPFAIAWYDGVEGNGCFSDTLQKDKLNPELAFFEEVKAAMDQICIRKYKNYTIYLHNFAKFDSYFLIKHLVKLGKVKPIIHKGKIITMKFTHKNGYSVFFKDSYLLLSSSLRELGQTFSTVNVGKGILAKGYFPFKLDDLNYKGEFPSKSLYPSNLSVKDYLELKNAHIKEYGDVWNFRVEALKYCMLDCLILLPGQKF